MITDDLIIYIQNQLKKNTPKDLIISRLIQVGWLEEDIQEGFNKIINLEKSSISLDVPFDSTLNQVAVKSPISNFSAATFPSSPVLNEEKKEEIIDLDLPEIVATKLTEKAEVEPVINSFEIEAPDVLLEISEEKKEEIIPTEIKEEEKIEAEPIINSYEIEAPESLLEINQPEELTKETIKETPKIWTPMRVNPIVQEVVIPQEVKKEEVNIPDVEIKKEEEKIEASIFQELIPKLIEKKPITSPVSPAPIISTPVIPTAETIIPKVADTPIIPKVPTSPVIEASPVIFDTPKVETVVPPVIKKPEVPISADVANMIKQNDKPGVFMDLSHGFKKEAGTTKEFSGNGEGEESNIVDVAKKAMISSYSQDFQTANTIQEKTPAFVFNKKTIVKAIIAILILSFIGGISYAFIGGYIKIPNFNMPFVRQDPRSLLLKNGDMFSQVKSYKVETEASISLLSLSNITSSLVNGADMGSSERDTVSVSTKGSVNKEGGYNSDFTSTIKSSILKEGITIDFKENGTDSFATVSDFAKVFGKGVPQFGMIKLSKDKINLISPELPLGLGDKAKELEIYQNILGEVFDENKTEISSAISTFIKDVKINKKGEEVIRDVNTIQYSITADRQVTKKLLSSLVGILTKDKTNANNLSLDALLGSVNIETFNVWIGKDDNNIHQYKITFKIPLSKVIKYEDKGIANSEIVFDLQSTYYDFDVANDISMPENAILLEEFLNAVKDSKIKEALSTFKINARGLYNAQGNYGKIENKTGVCDLPTSGSLFSPTGHSTAASSSLGEIASTLNSILTMTDNTGICYSTPKTWAMSVPLTQNPGEYYCIDNTNESPKTTTTLLLGSVCK